MAGYRFEEGDRRGRQVISNIEKIFRSFAFLSTVRSASHLIIIRFLTE